MNPHLSGIEIENHCNSLYEIFTEKDCLIYLHISSLPLMSTEI